MSSETTFHTPVVAKYVPWLGDAETKVRPAGKRSVNFTPVALFGPLFVTWTVNVMVSPTLGVVLLTDLVTARSAEKVVNLPKTKSESVEVSDVDERDSTTKLERCVGKPRAVRSMPPSKNSPMA